MNSQGIEFLAPLFTLLGVVITVFVRWVSIRHEVRYESLKIYAEKLSTARLEVYPLAYKILSDAIKRIDFPEAFSVEDKLNLAELEKKLNDWDSENGILLSRESGDCAFTLRKFLRNLIKENLTISSNNTTPHNIESLKELREALKELEIALRIDLSIYALEYGIVKHGFSGYIREKNT